MIVVIEPAAVVTVVVSASVSEAPGRSSSEETLAGDCSIITAHVDSRSWPVVVLQGRTNEWCQEDGMVVGVFCLRQ